ncbi:fimbrial protein [Citrobacter farmeri]|uniref:fimbrial protein n=1 Tax=Citrobacter farmeri TaxID=67824 RepID=UPI0021AD20B2|nr:fimbrial protein [Citrobacter farmeri]
MSRKINLLASLLFALSATAAYADGYPSTTSKIHFIGSIIEPSCEFDNGGEETVDLTTFLTSDFTSANADAPRSTQFSIALSHCPTPTADLPRVQLTFTGTTVANHPELLAVSKKTTADAGDTAATNIGIAINIGNEVNSNKLKLDGTEEQIYIDLPTIADSQISQDFTARYVAYAIPVTAGPADADMVVNLLYR